MPFVVCKLPLIISLLGLKGNSLLNLIIGFYELLFVYFINCFIWM